MKRIAWTRHYESRRAFIGGSDTRITIGNDERVLVRLRQEKRGEAEPEPRDSGSAKPSDSPVLAAHAEFVAALAGHPPRTIPLDADAIDLEDRANHLNTVLRA